MADLGNKDKGEFTIADPDNDDYELHVDQYGASYNLLRDDAGAVLKGEKVMASSLPVVVASDQTSIPVNATIAAIPPIPEGATAVNEETFGGVATTSGTDSFYTITNLKTLTIQTFIGGAEATNDGSVCELFYDPNGDLSVLTRIRTIWVNGDSFTVGVQQSYAGDGTARIVSRRRGYTASSREMEVAFAGYEETT